MRGDPVVKPAIIIAATIVDQDGTPKYHILPSKLITFGLLVLTLFLVIALILAFLVASNKTEIEEIRDKIRIDEVK